MKKILITWASKWIWKYLSKNLKNKFEIYSISRTKTCEKNNFNFDLCDFEKYDDFVLNLWDIKFDMIILNAWVWYFWDFFDSLENEYTNIINTNLTANILLLYKLKNHFNTWIKIVFIWSIAWKKFMKYWAVYQASKFGLRWFAWSLKNEFKIWKIHIINPKIVDTDFHNNSKIKLNFTKDMYTEKKDILEVILNILENKENRFEIDL